VPAESMGNKILEPPYPCKRTQKGNFTSSGRADIKDTSFCSVKAIGRMIKRMGLKLGGKS